MHFARCAVIVLLLHGQFTACHGDTRTTIPPQLMRQMFSSRQMESPHPMLEASAADKRRVQPLILGDKASLCAAAFLMTVCCDVSCSAMIPGMSFPLVTHECQARCVNHVQRARVKAGIVKSRG
ncbi:hypothetical protein B0H63DRAFT_467859 [Podospora didyma]|uniref:Uncharacterized protein n=1 Tax=Podospora didyma TaxID=330526 RepID=A0AAE0NRS0_9PEZI|nr:hypothetical protein B0H63DRAFT_467859 [Podospora didyma]